MNVGMFIHRMHKVNEQVRLYGTSSVQYSPVFKSRSYIKSRLKVESSKPPEPVLPFYKIHPNNKYLVFWTMIGMLMIFYCITFMPYGMVFVDNAGVNLFEDIMNYYFMVDIVVNFLTLYYDPETGLLETSLKKVAMVYISGFCFLDVISSVPIDLISSDAGSANKILRIFKIPRLLKVAGLSKLLKFENLFKGSSIYLYFRLNSGFVKTLSLAVATMLGLHLATCLFCALPSFDDNIEAGWIYRYALQDSPPSQIYLNAFYYCFVTLCTVGYGDILPSTPCSFSF